MDVVDLSAERDRRRSERAIARIQEWVWHEEEPILASIGLERDTSTPDNDNMPATHPKKLSPARRFLRLIVGGLNPRSDAGAALMITLVNGSSLAAAILLW